MPAVPGKHVLYFALQPTPEAAEQASALLAAARGKHGLKAKPLAPGRLHISLNYVGDFKRPPGPVIDKALETAEPVVARPFVVELNRLGSWAITGQEGPIVLWGDEGVVGVSDLYSTIHRAMVKTAMAPRREPEMTPHMTLLYDTIDVPETFVEPVRWRVEEFVLIHAVHGEGRHDVVGRFPLNG